MAYSPMCQNKKRIIKLKGCCTPFVLRHYCIVRNKITRKLSIEIFPLVVWSHFDFLKFWKICSSEFISQSCKKMPFGRSPKKIVQGQNTSWKGWQFWLAASLLRNIYTFRLRINGKVYLQCQRSKMGNVSSSDLFGLRILAWSANDEMIPLDIKCDMEWEYSIE